MGVVGARGSAVLSFLQESLQLSLCQPSPDWHSRDISSFRHSLFFPLLFFQHPSRLCYFASLPLPHKPHRVATPDAPHRVETCVFRGALLLAAFRV